MNKNKIYVNPKQREFLQNQSVKFATFFGGRGAGKSGAMALRMYERVAQMPRGHFFVGASTIDQFKQNILPDIKRLWRELLGLKEGVHYVIGKRPPKFFVEPISPAERFINVISWWNGAWTEIISYQKREKYRGASFDGGDLDEGLLWSWYAISNILVPTLRGNQFRFKNANLHYNISIYSSPPRTAEGMWLYNMEAKAQSEQKKFGWTFATCDDNVEILGADYKNQMRDVLNPEDFAVEVECQRNRIAGDSFYHCFDYNRHGYMTTTKGIIIGKRSTDYYSDQPIDLTFDFGANINVVWCIQVTQMVARSFDAMFVKFKDKLPVLIQKFCEAYKDHKNKQVNLYGEPFGLNKREDNKPLFNQVVDLFRKHGWTATIWVKPKDKADTHKSRFLKLNQILKEDNPRFPKFRAHRERCEDAIIAMMRTKVKDDFKKNKNEEKHPKRYAPEHAPHFTDALDNYLRQRFEYVFADRRGGGGMAGTF